MLPDDEMQSLSDDIKVNGLKEPIWLYEGQILDGRNRYRACEMAGVEFQKRTYTGTAPAAFVLSLNLKRRHLTPSQKATVAVEVLPWFEKEAKERQQQHSGTAPGKVKDTCGNNSASEGRARDHAAKAIGLNPHYVSDAKDIKDRAPDQFEAIKRGEKTISEVKRELKKEEVTRRVATLPTDKFRVLYADPPWKYGSDFAKMEGYDSFAAAGHYPCMAIAELCAMPIGDIVESDAVLFLWVTSPLLDECWPVIKAWGFEYKTSFVWDKVKHNMGHYNSVRHEFLLVCTRGSCTPDVKKLFDSVQVQTKKRKHSEKPESFRKIIDTIYPHGKRIELFARKKVKGWEAYGNEV